jgi:C4-dicarboxylate transporter DctQ subunit
MTGPEAAEPGGNSEFDTNLPRPGWLRIIENVEELACVVLTAAVVLAVALQVFYRYWLRSPLMWTDELSRYAVVWLTFAGAALTAARGGHVAIELGDSLLGKTGVRAVAIFSALMVLAACCLLVFGSAGPIEQAARRMSVALGAPLWVLTIAAPVGFALMGLHALRAAYVLLGGGTPFDRSMPPRSTV